MPYEIKKSMTYPQPFEEVYKAAYLTVQNLGGKVIKHDVQNKQLFAQMDKKFQGKLLGDRSQVEMTFSSDTEGNTVLSMVAYPLNAVGQKLMFGARKGVVETVTSGFLEEVTKKLAEKV
jgi:hypothetical protein